MKSEKELVIRSGQYTNVEVFLLDGKLAYLQLDYSEPDNKNNKITTMDNDEYVYQIFKVLSKANEMGIFSKVKDEEEKEDRDIPTIYV